MPPVRRDCTASAMIVNPCKPGREAKIHSDVGQLDAVRMAAHAPRPSCTASSKAEGFRNRSECFSSPSRFPVPVARNVLFVGVPPAPLQKKGHDNTHRICRPHRPEPSQPLGLQLCPGAGIALRRHREPGIAAHVPEREIPAPRFHGRCASARPCAQRQLRPISGLSTLCAPGLSTLHTDDRDIPVCP